MSLVAVDGRLGDKVDVDGLLGVSLDGTRYPVLAAALRRPNAPALRRELTQLFTPVLRARAPRRSVHAMCRLVGPEYNEPVLVRNISVTGVRFLVPSSTSIDLTRFSNLMLHVRMKSGPRTLAVVLVRRCGGNLRQTDLACRFLTPATDHRDMVAEIRSRILDDKTVPGKARR